MERVHMVLLNLCPFECHLIKLALTITRLFLLNFPDHIIWWSVRFGLLLQQFQLCLAIFCYLVWQLDPYYATWFCFILQCSYRACKFPKGATFLCGLYIQQFIFSFQFQVTTGIYVEIVQGIKIVFVLEKKVGVEFMFSLLV